MLQRVHTKPNEDVLKKQEFLICFSAFWPGDVTVIKTSKDFLICFVFWPLETVATEISSGVWM